jgi:AmmeMemoRadiSam system protein B
MSLVFVAIVPHTPLLLPTVGKERVDDLKKTQAAMEKLAKDLESAQPETVIVISPHGDVIPDALTLNMCPKYVTDFSEFGDLTTKLEWKSDIMLADRINEDFKTKHLPLVLGSIEKLDYGTAVPLTQLLKNLPNVKIVPILTSQLDAKTHFEVGRQLKDEVMGSTKRIAVIASADLSHRVSEDSPEGFSPRGVEFDQLIVDIATRHEHAKIKDVDDAWLKEAQACGARPLAVLYGMIDEVDHEAIAPSYEKPFGVGYLVVSAIVS